MTPHEEAGATAQQVRQAQLSAHEFRALYRRLREANPWGPEDRRGALSRLTPQRVLAAVGEVRSGRTVSLAAPVQTEQAPDNPEPAGHEATGPEAGRAAAEGVDFARDRIAMNIHGDADSHLDALCHVIYDAALYNGVPGGTTDAIEASGLTVDVARDGIVGRGVLLDIPAVRGVRWLEPGDHVTAADLAAAERSQGVAVGEGDLLFVRVGHPARRGALGAWNAAEHRAGLHPAAMEFLAARRVAVLGGDGNNDTAPSAVEGVAFPVHVLAVNAMGLHQLDYLQFEELLPVCAAEGRWSFLCVIAPLRFPAATGSPVNPIAIL